MKKKKLTASLLTTGLIISLTIPSWAGEWVQEESRPANASGVSNWWYREEDGSYPTNQWKQIDGKDYYFNADGWMLANTTTPDHYYVDAAGVWIAEGSSQNTTNVSQEQMIQWFNNHYAVLTESNRDNHQLYGGMNKSEYRQDIVKQGLQSSWGVTDRASADETLNWLLESGHRNTWLLEIGLMQIMGLGGSSESEMKEALGEEQGIFYTDMWNAYKRKGEDGISGWDYGRAMQLAAWYYIAGYYSYEEALDKSLEIGRLTQSKFSSWEDMTESYLRGYEYWRGSRTAYVERKGIYDRLKASDHNPYTVDWNLSLGRAW